MDVVQFLLHFLPTHWPQQWRGSFQTTDGGPDQKIDSVTQATHATDNGKPTISFTFDVGGAPHTIAAEIVDFNGSAQIQLDKVSKTDHPVVNVGTAFHFPPSTTAIVHLIFNEDGERQNYRFEGKVS